MGGEVPPLPLHAFTVCTGKVTSLTAKKQQNARQKVDRATVASVQPGWYFNFSTRFVKNESSVWTENGRLRNKRHLVGNKKGVYAACHTNAVNFLLT